MAKLCLLLWGFFFFFFCPSAKNLRYILVYNTLTWNFSISFVSSSVTYVYLQIKIQFAQPLWKLAFLFRLAEIIGGKTLSSEELLMNPYVECRICTGDIFIVHILKVILLFIAITFLFIGPLCYKFWLNSLNYLKMIRSLMMSTL